MLRTLGSLLLWFVFLGLVTYHLMNGPRSIFKREQIRETLATRTLELSALKADNAAFEAKMAGLRPSILDEDLLIERLHAYSLTLEGEELLYTSD